MTRLAPLGRSIPVLRPEDVELPLTGRKPGQTGGLSGYLAAHPQGYVQLYDATGVYTTDGIYDEHLAPVDAVASTEAIAFALSQQIRRLLSRTPRTGGRIVLFLPPQTTRDGVSVRVTQQFQVSSAHPTAR